MTERKTIDWIARILSIAAVMISAAGLYYSNFYKPEDLIVTARVEQHAQVGSDHLNVVSVFTNSGKQPVAIEKILLLMYYGKGAKIEDIADWNIEGQARLRDVGSVPTDKIKMSEGTFLSIHDALNIRLNNQQAASTTTLVEANSVALMIIGFALPSLDVGVDGPIVLALAVRYFDQLGQSRISIVPVGTLSEVFKGRLYNPAQPSAFFRLLPVF